MSARVADDKGNRCPGTLQAEGESIDATFRNGTLTAISVVFGFSLSFLTRWAGLPGPWYAIDLFALASIILGIALQSLALARLLIISSLLMRKYHRTVGIFLTGLVLVAAGVGLAIAGDIVGYGQRLLGW